MAGKKQDNASIKHELLKTRLLMSITRHVGQSNRIGMGALYESVFEKNWNHRINDTRPLRKLITELRRDGVAICSSPKKSAAGYWLASAGSELDGYCAAIRSRALRLLAQESKLRKTTMPALLGQMQIEYSQEAVA